MRDNTETEAIVSKIQFTLFDVGNVILRATHAITYAILWELGVRPDKAALFFHSKAYADFARGKITGEQFAQAVREACEAPHLTDEQIRAAHDAHIYMVDGAVMMILNELRDRERALGFVTTTNEWQTAREESMCKLQTDFGHVVRSHVVGVAKTDPDAWPVIFAGFRPYVEEWNYLSRDRRGQGNVPNVYVNFRAYRRLLERCQLQSILFVDDASANCDAARRAGLQTHQYDPTPGVGVKKLRAALRERGLLR